MAPVRRPLRTRNDDFQVITSVRCSRRKRAQRGLLFVESVAAINAAVAAGCEAESAVVRAGARLSGWARDRIRQLDVGTVYEASDPLFRELSERSDPSEMLLLLHRPEIKLEGIPISETAIIVVLDRPSNHGNLGSIIRTADAFGIAAVVTTGHAVDHYDPAVIRSSMGAVFTTPVTHEPSVSVLLSWIKTVRRRFPDADVVGTDSGGEKPLDQWRRSGGPLIAIFGNEATGVSPQLRTTADSVLTIPMSGHVNSLNLACAASIVLHSLRAKSET
jgi:tRNA G18 (ribose-2'-O)-methylase SpoU